MSVVDEISRAQENLPVASPQKEFNGESIAVVFSDQWIVRQDLERACKHFSQFSLSALNAQNFPPIIMPKEK